MSTDPAARIVFVTAPDMQVARGLAREVVEGRLAACVNLVPAVISIYTWQGELQEDGEVLMVLKTAEDRLAELEARLLELHPYETPEFVALEARHVAPDYRAWLVDSTRPDAS